MTWETPVGLSSAKVPVQTKTAPPVPAVSRSGQVWDHAQVTQAVLDSRLSTESDGAARKFGGISNSMSTSFPGEMADGHRLCLEFFSCVAMTQTFSACYCHWQLS